MRNNSELSISKKKQDALVLLVLIALGTLAVIFLT
jgi:hypothetical protein|tara:strand:+ start:9960 stop:10064 length:105 start_codon:yes stop_codon:yes gene_type:complete